MKKEEKLVTKEEALERIDENLETINSAFGKIKFNKIFFGVCAGIGVVCTGAGIIGTAVWGLSVASAVATGFGAGAAITGGIFYKQQNDEELKYNGLEEDMLLAKDKVLSKKVK